MKFLNGLINSPRTTVIGFGGAVAILVSQGLNWKAAVLATFAAAIGAQSQDHQD